jgi:quinohemoprotein ethanol dehydrogenase
MKNLLLPITAVLFLFSCAENDPYTSRLLNADSDNESWLLHGRTYDESRFSPLTDINDSNVNQLGLSW